jgi:hypothetical protein
VRKTCIFAIGILMFFSLSSSAPKAHATSLSPCAQWTDSKGSQITQQEAMDRMAAADKDGATDETKERADMRCSVVETALGKIDTDSAKFVQKIFSIVLGLAGGIALVMIILSGYKFMSSGGNPEKVKAAQEQLTSSIVGLLFIIFAFVILQIIGVDILRIPGFEK